MIHPLTIDNCDIPERMNSPFAADVPPVVTLAAQQVMSHVAASPRLQAALQPGKMLGVLVVRDDASGKYGYLAAYSGNLPRDIENDRYFVPPIFDLRNVNSFFIEEERAIVEINRQINAIITGMPYAVVRETLAHVQTSCEQKIKMYRWKMEQSKAERHRLRATTSLSPEEQADLIRRSQHEKAEFRRLKQQCEAQVEEARKRANIYEKQLEHRKRMRADMSFMLQQRIFEAFIIHNFRGETKTLLDIFADTPLKMPPAGAGECAAPRLLQYACVNGYIPVGIGEFWYGDSPVGEVRHHGHFYEACVAKCHPILNFMLQGLEYEATEHVCNHAELQLLYEDDYILAVNKPAGMLSVPGKITPHSVVSILSESRGETLYAVHRLDRDTSGVLLLARSQQALRAMQRLMSGREAEKIYMAVLAGVPQCYSGDINLPLRSDYMHRPRQVVDAVAGKPAHTSYSVMAINDEYELSLVKFVLHTGRTHQLRVHSAHASGLSIPIVGDKLYGTSHWLLCRMMLHAAQLSFTHPLTGEQIVITAPMPPEFDNIKWREVKE